jgi:hypothetical protein
VHLDQSNERSLDTTRAGDLWCVLIRYAVEKGFCRWKDRSEISRNRTVPNVVLNAQECYILPSRGDLGDLEARRVASWSFL